MLVLEKEAFENPAPNDVKFQSGHSLVFNWKKKKWIGFADFTFKIERSSFEDEQKVNPIFIMDCTTTMMGNSHEFSIPITKKDLDSVKKLMEQIKIYKAEHSASIDEEAFKAGQIHLFVRRLVETYLKNPQIQQDAIIARKRGFVKSARHGRVYVLGKGEVISTKGNISSEEMKKELVWLGKSSKKLKICDLGTDKLSTATLFLKDFESFHADNSEAGYAILGWTFCTMSRNDLKERNVKIPSIHLIGPCMTGKTSMLQEIATTFPHAVREDGSFFREKEPGMSIPLIYEQVVAEREPLFLDNPGEIRDMSEVIDSMFEGNVKLNKNSYKWLSGKDVNTGLACHWPGHLDSLKALGVNATFLTKSIILFFATIDADWPSLQKHHENIMQNSFRNSHLFRVYLEKIENMDTFMDIKRQCHDNLVQSLNTVFQDKPIKEVLDYRIIANYALACAGFQLFLEVCGFSSQAQEEKTKRLESYFTEKCIPSVLMEISDLRPKRSQPPQDLGGLLVDKIRDGSVRNLVEFVSFSNDCVSFKKSTIVKMCEGAKGQLSKLFQAEKYDRKLFLAADSEELYFKKSTDNSFKYGKGERAISLVVPIANIPAKIMEVISMKINEVTSSSNNLCLPTSNFSKVLRCHFDSVYEGKATNNPFLHRVHQLTKDLGESQKEKIIGFIEKLKSQPAEQTSPAIEPAPSEHPEESSSKRPRMS